jgi:hypothetical protein
MGAAKGNQGRWMLLVGSKQWKVKRCGVVLLSSKDSLHAGQEQGAPEMSAPQHGTWLRASLQRSWDRMAQRCVQVLTLVLVVPIGFQIKAVLSTNNCFSVYAALVKGGDE